MDFKDALKDIKKDMQKEIKKEAKSEFDCEKESVLHREKRLKEEFLEYIEFNNIKKGIK